VIPAANLAAQAKVARGSSLDRRTKSRPNRAVPNRGSSSSGASGSGNSSAKKRIGATCENIRSAFLLESRQHSLSWLARTNPTVFEFHALLKHPVECSLWSPLMLYRLWRIRVLLGVALN